MSSLLMMIGVPGGGKSSLALSISQVLPESRIVSSDRIRAQLFGNATIQGHWEAIWQEIQAQFEQAFQHQQAVIYDATNAVYDHRRVVLDCARNMGFSEITGIWVNPSLELCLRRNLERSRQVPESVILQMFDILQQQPPRLAEGFDHLFCTHPGSTEIAIWEISAIHTSQSRSL